MKKNKDIYMEPEVYQHNNCIVKGYHPILTEEERARRMEKIKQAVIALLIESEKISQDPIGSGAINVEPHPRA